MSTADDLVADPGQDEAVIYEVTATGVAVMTLNRPDRLNTWGGDIATAFYQETGNPLGAKVLKHVQPADPLVNEGSVPIFIGQQDRIARQFAGSRHDNAPRLPLRGARSYRQSRVITAYGFRADENCVDGGTERMDQTKRLVI